MAEVESSKMVRTRWEGGQELVERLASERRLESGSLSKARLTDEENRGRGEGEENLDIFHFQQLWEWQVILWDGEEGRCNLRLGLSFD